MDYEVTLTGDGFALPWIDLSPTVATAVDAATRALLDRAGTGPVAIVVNGPHAAVHARLELNDAIWSDSLHTGTILDLMDRLRGHLHRLADHSELLEIARDDWSSRDRMAAERRSWGWPAVAETHPPSPDIAAAGSIRMTPTGGSAAIAAAEERSSLRSALTGWLDVYESWWRRRQASEAGRPVTSIDDIDFARPRPPVPVMIPTQLSTAR